MYGNSLKQTDLARLERVQYGAAKLVTGGLYHTSREKLNNELGWENIKTRIDFLGLSIFHKIHLKETRPLVRSCLTKLDFEKNNLQDLNGVIFPIPITGLNTSVHFSRIYQNFGTTWIPLHNQWNYRILKQN